MFKIELPERVKWPVKIPVGEDGGTVRQLKMTAYFKVLPQDRLDEITRGKVADALLGAGDTDGDLLREVLVGFDDVGDAEGAPLEFSDEVRDQLINITTARTALIQAYMACIQGRAAKN